MTRAQRWCLLAWLIFVAASAAIVARTSFTTDISAFLPRSPTPAQQVLVEQIREGVVSRLMLVGIENAAPEVLARVSKEMAAELRKHDGFVSVDNGDGASLASDRDFLWRNRYLLSSGVTPKRFSADELRARLEENLRLLGSPAGSLVGRVVPSDPSGELLHLLERFEGGSGPAMRQGVWFSRDSRRALLLAQTRAAGYDIDAQERALAQVRGAFALANAGEARLLLSG